MKRCISIFFMAYVLFVFPAALNAQENQEYEDIFHRFLFKLVERHEELKILPMPDVEIRTVPGIENEALYLLTFKSPENAQTLIDALKKEGIPYVTFPQKEQQVALFYQDIAIFTVPF